MPEVLRGRVAAVTGGARGIGRATAAALIREGVAVAIGGRNLAAAERAAAELGHGTIALPLDVSDRASFAAFLDAAERRLGPVDILVNNAGIMLVGPPVWEEDDDAARRQIETNAIGVLNGIREALPRFRARGRGHVVNVASGAGKLGFAGGATYCGSKHFVVGVSEALRAELHGSGIDVSLVMPAIVRTELAAGHRPIAGMRTADPEDVAAAIVDAVRRRRFDVYVPRELGVFCRARTLLPRALFEALLRAAGADRVLTDLDPAARADYERRAVTAPHT